MFHLPLPEVNDNIDWNMLYEASSDDIRYHIHLHAQPYYIDAVSQRIISSPLFPSIQGVQSGQRHLPDARTSLRRLRLRL